MHKRIDIRRYLLPLLKQHIDVGGRVYMSRPNPVFMQELPCQCVYFVSEPVEHQNSGPRVYQRRLTIQIDTIAGNNYPPEKLDDFLDQLAYQTEVVLLANRTMDGIVYEVSLTDTRPVVIEFEGQTPVYSIRQSFLVEYDTEGPYNTGDITEFLRYNAEWTNKNGNTLAEDSVTIREA